MFEGKGLAGQKVDKSKLTKKGGGEEGKEDGQLAI